MDEQTRSKLHMEIMNIPCNPPEPDPHALEDGETYAYKLGHRDARHAAAELVTAAALSQPAAAQGGWIGWGGGDCPVAPGVMVEVRLRNAALSSHESRSAEFWDWESTKDDCDIVAYRVTKATP